MSFTSKTVLFCTFLLISIFCVSNTLAKPQCDVKFEEYDCSDGLICLNGTCGACTYDEQCHNMNPEYICTFRSRWGKKLDAGMCIHKDILPVDYRDIIAGFFLFITSSIAGSSGLGGGGLFVPILFLIGSFNAHEAVPLSKAIIFGGAVANFILNVHKRFPGQVNKLMIDYKVASFMTPSILAGTTLGVTLNVMLPAWLILIILAATLCLTTWRMTKKGVEKYREETKAPESQPLIPTNSPTINEEDDNESRIPTYKLVPYGLITFLVAVEIYVIVMTLLKGSKEGASLLHIKLCSAPFFILFFLIFLVVFSLTGIVAVATYKRMQRMKLNSVGFRKPDVINWTKKNMTVLSFGSFIGGILAGLVGIGGGMVSSPILLEIGVHPQIVMATSTFLILFTSSSTTIQYLILGKLPLMYSLVFGIMAFISNIIGNLLIDYLIKKYKKTFLIIFIVASVVGLSALMLGISGVVSVVKVIQSGHGATFHSLCSV